MLPKFGAGVLAVYVVSDMARDLLVFGILAWLLVGWGLLPGFQGVGLAFGVQDAGLVSDGRGSFWKRCV